MAVPRVRVLIETLVLVLRRLSIFCLLHNWFEAADSCIFIARRVSVIGLFLVIYYADLRGFDVNLMSCKGCQCSVDTNAVLLVLKAHSLYLDIYMYAVQHLMLKLKITTN